MAQAVVMQAAPVMGTPQSATDIAQPAGPDKVTKLKGLKERLDSGVLTQEEFDYQKKITLAGGKGRFDAYTGEENPKFDPMTGIQNW